MPIAKSVALKEPFDEGVPGPEHFDIVESEVPQLTSDQEGWISVKITAMSADPYLRSAVKTTGSVGAGGTMNGFVVGKVLTSNGNEKWQVGDSFGAALPFTTIQNLSPDAMSKTIMWKLSGLVESDQELSLGLGVLGMPGSTAYGGLTDVLAPKNGETIFISAASGAVGSLVGMLAKRVFNCTVIGSCGGPEKCALIKEKFGFDHAIDYKTISNAQELTAALKAVAPDGIDMYFENVGGMHFDAAFASLRPHGRIAVCGGISQYNSVPELNSINPLQMIYTFQRIEGFVCMPWLSGQKGNFLSDMHQYLREGKLVVQETFYDGIESWPEAFQALFTGKNLGKVVVKIE